MKIKARKKYGIEKHVKNCKQSFESSHSKCTAQIKNNVNRENNYSHYRLKKQIRCPDVNQLDSIVREAIEDFMQSFLKIKYKCENKVRFVPGKKGKDEAFFTLEVKYGSI